MTRILMLSAVVGLVAILAVFQNAGAQEPAQSFNTATIVAQPIPAVPVAAQRSGTPSSTATPVTGGALVRREPAEFTSLERMTPLQKTYANLVIRHSRTMTDEELEVAIDDIQADLDKKVTESEARLQENIAKLEKDREASRGTVAADRIEAALLILQGGVEIIKGTAENTPPQVYRVVPTTLPNRTTPAGRYVPIPAEPVPPLKATN